MGNNKLIAYLVTIQQNFLSSVILFSYKNYKKAKVNLKFKVQKLKKFFF